MDLSTTFGCARLHGLSPRNRRAMKMALAVFALGALLAAFVLVLRGGVAQSDQRWRNEAVEADAVWRCKALRGASAQATCRASAPGTRAAP
jgi:putative exporter of polyketide antibiotics